MRWDLTAVLPCDVGELLRGAGVLLALGEEGLLLGVLLRILRVGHGLLVMLGSLLHLRLRVGVGVHLRRGHLLLLRVLLLGVLLGHHGVLPCRHLLALLLVGPVECLHLPLDAGQALA